MKLCKLKLKNLNSFRREINIDFEESPLGDASLVAITGPTGSGKTTLLDAICVALYGNTPRLSGNASQHPRHLISHGEKEGFAEVHFMANRTRYIATWSIQRKGPAKVRLSYAEDRRVISDRLSGKGKALGSSQRTVSEEVESILGLDFNAFRRSVMLAQGDFAAFLKASKEQRRTILEATAGIGIYEILKDTLNKKVSEVEAANADVLNQLRQIPEASHEQITEAESELDRLENEAKTLKTQSKEVQQEKARETKRTEDYEKLQSSEERQVELLDLQPKIDVLQAEREDAERAKDIRSEKREYDTAKSDLKEAKKALRVATTGKTDAEKQVNADQADLEKKEDAYQTTATQHKQKIDTYTDAKLDVARAADQFAEVDKRTTVVEDLDSQIGTLSDELTDKETEQTKLQKQINKARTFLDENPLPSDRQHRLTQANVLLVQLDSQQKQLETALTSEAVHSEKVSSLKREIEKLSKTHAERLSKKTAAADILKSADAELNRLQAAGTQDEWNSRKQRAVEVQPIAQKYETAADDLTDSEDRLHELNAEKAKQDTGLEQIGEKLAEQETVCQHAEEAVKRCEETRESALLANPINKLRQHLHTGEVCLVCGATEHPFADDVETESEELLQETENALELAKTELKTAQGERQTWQTQQIETKRDKRNTAEQIKDCGTEIETLQDEKAKRLAEWQAIYPNNGVSSDWIAKQIEKVDTAIADLGAAEKAHTDASNAYKMAAQQFKTCEDDIAREEKSLSEVKKQLRDASNAVAGLQADIASTEKRFWKFLPETFHGVAPDVAVDQFDMKIEEVATHKDKLDAAETNLKLINAKIESDQNSLENLRQGRDDLQAEIDGYQREGGVLLDALRDKTGGLETEDAINAAIKKLEAELKLKETAHDAADQQLQESQRLLTEKRTTHKICEDQRKECDKKFQAARDAYFGKLKDTGFDSPEAHDNAFREDVQIQELTDQIDVHENKKGQLALDITELRTRFEETPFDSEALERIETKVKKIGEQLQAKQQEVWAQQQKIDDLKDALKKREALGGEVAAAEVELMRWKRLRETIPQNSLRDFALEIMFKQMGTLANEQLKYLTSERYQLKVETIGDLTVIDRWNANEERPVETLSGGESFLTSLALALALADLSRGRAQLNSLFLDEGFGTLDAETLDTAIAALEGLRMQGRSIFLISHIQELTRRLPVKINVRKHGSSSSDSPDSLFSSSIDIRG